MIAGAQTASPALSSQDDGSFNKKSKKGRRSAETAARNVRFAELTSTFDNPAEALRTISDHPEMLEREDDASVELRSLVRNVAALLLEREERGAVPSVDDDEPRLVAFEAQSNVESTARRISVDLQHAHLHETAAQALKGIRAAAAAIEDASRAAGAPIGARAVSSPPPGGSEKISPSSASPSCRSVDGVDDPSRLSPSDEHSGGERRFRMRAPSITRLLVSPESYVREVASSVKAIPRRERREAPSSSGSHPLHSLRLAAVVGAPCSSSPCSPSDAVLACGDGGAADLPSTSSGAPASSEPEAASAGGVAGGGDGGSAGGGGGGGGGEEAAAADLAGGSPADPAAPSRESSGGEQRSGRSSRSSRSRLSGGESSPGSPKTPLAVCTSTISGKFDRLSAKMDRRSAGAAERAARFRIGAVCASIRNTDLHPHPHP